MKTLAGCVLSSAFCLGILFNFTGCKPKPVAPVVKEGEGVPVASVGDAIITDKMLMDRVSAIEKSFPRVYSTHPQKKALLEEMMNIELLYDEAMRQHLNEKYEFKSRLADLYVQKLAEEARAKITDDEIRKYFNAHREQIEQISARHILLKFPPGADSATRRELRKRIEGYRAELMKDPTKFADYARKYSDDGSKNSGGELGYFSREMMVKPFSDAAFKLTKIGEISPVIETQFGYHLIQLSGDRRSFDNYKESLKDQLLRETQRERLDHELARLREGKKWEIYEDNLVKLSPMPSEVTTDPAKLLPEKLPDFKATKK